MSRADRLALIVAGLIVAATALRALPWNSASSATPVPETAAEAPPAPLPPLDQLSVVTEHDLFAPSRAAAVSMQNQLGGAALVGIVFSGGRQAALLRLADGTSKIIVPGAAFSGWTLVSLDKNHASLRRDGATTTLSLNRTNP
jgi:hypothetical protein